MSSNWTFSIFSCCSTPLLSFATCCLCPCQVGRQRATLMESFGCGQCIFVTLCLPLAAFLNRYEIRSRYNIRGNALSDGLCCCLCGCCATVQQARELNYKGNKPGALFMSSDEENNYTSPASPTYQSNNYNSDRESLFLDHQRQDLEQQRNDNQYFGDDKV